LVNQTLQSIFSVSLTAVYITYYRFSVLALAVNIGTIDIRIERARGPLVRYQLRERTLHTGLVCFSLAQPRDWLSPTTSTPTANRATRRKRQTGPVCSVLSLTLISFPLAGQHSTSALYSYISMIGTQLRSRLDQDYYKIIVACNTPYSIIFFRFLYEMRDPADETFRKLRQLRNTPLQKYIRITSAAITLMYVGAMYIYYRRK